MTATLPDRTLTARLAAVGYTLIPGEQDRVTLIRARLGGVGLMIEMSEADAREFADRHDSAGEGEV